MVFGQRRAPRIPSVNTFKNLALALSFVIEIADAIFKPSPKSTEGKNDRSIFNMPFSTEMCGK